MNQLDRRCTRQEVANLACPIISHTVWEMTDVSRLTHAVRLYSRFSMPVLVYKSVVNHYDVFSFAIFRFACLVRRQSTVMGTTRDAPMLKVVVRNKLSESSARTHFPKRFNFTDLSIDNSMALKNLLSCSC